MILEYRKVRPNTRTPERANPSDAGWDLYADDDMEIWPGETKLISTGVSLEIPDGYVGLIWDRSSMGVKGIHRHAGVIDSGYRGEVKVCLHNSKHSNVNRMLSDMVDKKKAGVLTMSRGDRIAQILFQEAPVFKLVETDALVETARGAGGFGSSGK